ncbi:DMT family transporter [Prevotella koreensis]|uniref:DMT family transporter n=1 Tax=Prevotella koreensis TaxID=2490854 RepID=A0A3S0WKB0_9BACT|nr:DMT family transporter [Prevotella koreensis]RUL59348.1 DMT family transporter [Prevotella koreensis]
MKRENTMLYHLVAFLTIAVWGTTFVWTKLLIQNGLSPVNIFTIRFLMAYVLLLGFSLIRVRKHKFMWFANGWKEELKMMGLGITAGSMYFLSENAALQYTTATNASLIVCSCPLFTMLLFAAVYKSELFNKIQIIGSMLAFAGMAIVVLNGRFVLHLQPAGDSLAFAACISWAIYSLLMKPMTGRYPTLFLTRKVFFYGLVTALPYYIITPGLPPAEVLMRPQVIANLLFLGCVASMVCYLTWNWCMAKLGAMVATNWVYFNPIATIVVAWWVLDEQITGYFIVGSALILAGMYLSDKRGKNEDKAKLPKA